MFSFWKTLNLDITLLGNLDLSSKTLTHYEIIRELLKDIEYAFTCSCKDISGEHKLVNRDQLLLRTYKHLGTICYGIETQKIANTFTRLRAKI
jgi:hypothetical protein